LAVPVAPVVLDALHMPLVDDDHDFLALGAVDFVEQLFVALVNADPLPLGEESSDSGDIPVDQVLVHALFGEGGSSNQVVLNCVIIALLNPEGVAPLEALDHVIN